MNEKKLFVGSLAWETTDADLRQAFEQAGTVVSATVIMDKMSGRSKGFGFVEMGSPEEAQAAVDMWNGKELGGRAIVVNVARPMEERAPRRDFNNDRSGGYGNRGGYGGNRGGYDRR